MLLLKFSVMLLVSVCIISILVWAIISRKIILRDLYASFIFTIGVSLIVLNIIYGVELNDRLSMPFNVSREQVSDVNYMDSTITDSLLYSMIKELRIPHGKIVFAQAKLESGRYTSELYKTNNNLFGMRYATRRPTITNKEYMGFQMYHNWKESVVDYLIWQLSNKVDKLSEDRYFEYLQSVYAEDPTYVSKLKNIINNTNFDKLQ